MGPESHVQVLSFAHEIALRSLPAAARPLPFLWEGKRFLWGSLVCPLSLV